MPPSKKTELSAEELSFQTGKPLRDFPQNRRIVAGLPEDHVVRSLNELPDKATPTPPSKKRKVAFSPPEKGKPKSSVSKTLSFDKDKVESAIQQVAGLLVLLNEKERSAVLNKVTGVFLQKKDVVTKSKKAKAQRPKDSSKVLEKTDANAVFSKTHSGQFLTYTSKVLRKCRKDSKEKPSQALHKVHQHFLNEKARFRGAWDHGAAKVEVKDTTVPESDLQHLVTAVSCALEAATAEGINLPDDSVAQALCLIRGQSVKADYKTLFLLYDKEKSDPAPLSIPRTDKEAEERAAAILSSKRKKKAGAHSSDLAGGGNKAEQATSKKSPSARPPPETSVMELDPDL